MRWAVPVARIRGVPIRVHVTFALLAAVLLWRALGRPGPGVALTEAWLVLLLFSFVLLHEGAHVAAAARLGIATRDIVLHPFGGVARFDRQALTAREEMLVAAAGPLANLGLAAALLAALQDAVLDPGTSPWLRLGALAFWANGLLGAFNLLPAFPLDGGRVLRAALATRLGPDRATVWAASAGQVAAVVLMGLGLVHEPWLLVGGLLLLPSANVELRRALRIREITSRRVADVMHSEVEEVAAGTTLEELVRASQAQPMVVFAVRADRRLLGYVPAARVWSLAARDDGSGSTAAAAAIPLAADLAPTTGLVEALEALEGAGAEAAAVVDDEGVLVGVVTRHAVERSLQLADSVARRFS